MAIFSALELPGSGAGSHSASVNDLSRDIGPPYGRTGYLPAGGQLVCRGSGQRRHPLPRGGFGEAEAGAFGEHEGNANGLGIGLVSDREYPGRTAPVGRAAGTARDRRRFRSTRLDIRCAAPEGIVVITDTAAPDPGGGRNYRLAVSSVSSPQTPGIVDGTRPDAGPAAVPALRPPGCRGPRLRIEPDGVMTPPLAGQPGHGRTAFARRQPVRVVNGRFDGGYADVFELICPGCGDDPYLDYTAVPPRLQLLRRPRALQAALTACHKHIGASPRLDGTEPEA
jgi:hypothetical protein